MSSSAFSTMETFSPTTIHGNTMVILCSKTYCIAYMDSILRVSKGRMPSLGPILRQQTQKSPCHTGSTTSYLHSLLRVYMPSRSLRLVSERYNHKEAQNHAFVHCFLLVEWYSQHYPDNWISDNIQETHTYSNCNLQKKNRCFHYSLVLLCSTLYYFCTKQQCLYCWHFLCLFPLKMNRMLYSSFVNRFR